MNWLLEVYNSGVVSDTTSSDGIPDGKPSFVASGLDFDTSAFVLGIFVGVILTFIIIGIVKYAKFIIRDNKEMQEKLNSRESDDE